MLPALLYILRGFSGLSSALGRRCSSSGVGGRILVRSEIAFPSESTC